MSAIDGAEQAATRKVCQGHATNYGKAGKIRVATDVIEETKEAHRYCRIKIITRISYKAQQYRVKVLPMSLNS